MMYLHEIQIVPLVLLCDTLININSINNDINGYFHKIVSIAAGDIVDNLVRVLYF